MISPMEKVTILIFHKAKEDFLDVLQELGILHISQEAREGMPDKLKEMKECIRRADEFVKAAFKEIKQSKLKPESKGKSASIDAFSYVQQYEQIKEEISRNQNLLDKLERQIRNLKPWGEFDPALVTGLKEAGIRTRFFITPIKKFSQCELEESISAHEVSRDKTYVYFVVFEKDKKTEIDCDEFFYPKTDIKTLYAERDEAVKSIEEAKRQSRELFSHVSEVVAYRSSQETRLAYATVRTNLPATAENTVYVINGWIPVELKPELKTFLDECDAYHYFSKPQVDEDVPILLKNNRFARLFEPITKLFSLPDYAELDLTAFLAPFFTLFFGFCLGDVGYGLIIFLGALLARLKVSDDRKAICSLVMILGISTSVFGIITGTFFGSNLVNVPLVKKLVLLKQDQLFYLALVLGVVQVIFGMFLKAVNRIRQYGFLASLSAFGWIIMLAGILSMNIVKNSAWAIFIGMGLILFFNDLKANIFVRIGKGLWELYGITGVIGDVLSYLRLFALGVSSAILGLVINNIAFQLKEIPYFGWILTFLFLIVFHSMNLFLSSLSSFVHPLRLTFVEFFKNVEYKGGGKAYSPFRQIK